MPTETEQRNDLAVFEQRLLLGEPLPETALWSWGGTVR